MKCPECGSHLEVLINVFNIGNADTGDVFVRVWACYKCKKFYREDINKVQRRR